MKGSIRTGRCIVGPSEDPRREESRTIVEAREIARGPLATDRQGVSLWLGARFENALSGLNGHLRALGADARAVRL